MKTQHFHRILFGLTLILIHSVRADVIYNNFGPNDTYDGSSGNTVHWQSQAGTSSSAAAGFMITGGNYALSSVSLALSISSGVTNNLAIYVVADSGGVPGETPLETLVTHPTDVTTLHSVVTYSSSLNPVLDGGSYYWLVAAPADLNVLDSANDTDYFWYAGPVLGAAGVRDFNFTTENWNDWRTYSYTASPAFRIEGYAVPEPGTLSLLLIGLGLVAVRGWKQIQTVPR